MLLKVQKWGNSVALRIPKSFASEINVQSGTLVDLSLKNKKLIISPLFNEEFNLKSMLSQINKNNIHKEIKTGKPAGKELW